MLLERMELSDGMRQICGLTQMTLIPSRHSLSKVRVQKPIRYKLTSESTQKLGKTALVDTQYGLRDEEYHCLKRIFERFCAFGDQGNQTQLKASMFVKLLKEAGLVPGAVGMSSGKILQITVTEADIIFKRCCEKQ